MGGVWGREEETEDEETAGEEEEVEEEEREEKEEEGEEEEKEGEKIWGGNGSLALGRKEEEEEEGSFEDEEVNRALVVNIKEKINKLEETVRLRRMINQHLNFFRWQIRMQVWRKGWKHLRSLPSC